jgi:hypothetical protein
MMCFVLFRRLEPNFWGMTGIETHTIPGISPFCSISGWSTTKEILGWLFDGTTHTVSITKEKHDKLMTRIDELLKDANKKRP